MFQNLKTKPEDYKKFEVQSNTRNSFNRKELLLSIIGLFVSMASFNSELAPFGFALFAACCSNRKPAGLIYLLTLIGTLIKFGISGFFSYLVTSLLFIIVLIITRPNIDESGRNEKQKIGIYVFFASFIVQALKMFFTGFLLYDLILSTCLGIITYIFYKIFANSLVVISEYSSKKAFSIEEVLGASILIAISLVSINGLKVFGLSVTNIISVMLVLFLGWQHGILIGATSGITIGMVLGIVTGGSPILVASYAISGMIAGILNKLGKIGVIVGFCLGNAVLTYMSNGNTVPIITIREILIASLGLLVIPKEIKINIDDIIPQVKCFPVTSGVLDGNTVEKLNTVSETIADMAKSCSESANDILENNDIEEENRELFIDDLYNNFEDIEDNIFYDDITQNDEVAYSIYECLINNNEITYDNIAQIIEKENNYKLVQNDETKKNIEDIVRLVNATYRVHKLNILWRVKEATHKKVLANQLGGVSKVISNLAEDMEEKDNKHLRNDKYTLQNIVLTKTKSKSEVSGDNNLEIELQDGKYLLAISDGMGSGKDANKSSKTVINMLERLLKNGFDKETSIGLINSSINLNSTKETYATIDLLIANLENGNVEFVKNGACPTFIKSNNRVETVKAVSFPAGMLDKIDLVVYDKDLKENDIIVMCSDGILESNTEYANKEIWLKNLLENIQTDDIEKIANIIITESIDNGFGVAKDDMTVIVAKLFRKK